MANISIPSYLDDPLSYVLEAVDAAVGEGITPIHMSVNEKDIEETSDSTKSVLFKSKIHVDKNKRSKVRDEVVEYLNNLLDNTTTLPFQEVIGGTKSNPDAEQFDLVVRNAGSKPQVIRILVKPTAAGGSGGGAAKTKVQEVGQALFLAIRYMKGKDLECNPKDPKNCLARILNHSQNLIQLRLPGRLKLHDTNLHWSKLNKPKVYSKEPRMICQKPLCTLPCQAPLVNLIKKKVK